MQRTQRQASLVQQVQAAMSRLDESRLKARDKYPPLDSDRSFDVAVLGVTS